ncbi:hypothetical protein SAMN04487851_102271 [Prevotella sp. tc2-28]|uniref:O-antigen ligase family protein n=1 Tax=Prevotella sp. tc2-28 TaxID=1761888 RepID=UPI00089BB836|nr:O-antigen ligase family protein [Prevotella sp. tc2-28]SEA09408.1 hypothetical protein SAMN04487851_102271 [Prevotella sp. tc2-28]
MKAKVIINNIAKAIFLFSSFTVWFALTPYLRWNIFLILLLCGVNAILYLSLPKLSLPKDSFVENVIMIMLVVIISLSFIFNIIFNPHPKLLSNFLGMLVVIVVFYFYYNAVIYSYIKTDLIIKWCAYGGVLVILISVLDGVLANFFNIRIHDWFVYGFPGNASYFDRAIWSSPCSPCVEPAETALYINCLFPFCLYYFKGIKKYYLIILYIFCIFELFSSAGIFTMITGALFYLYMTQPKMKMFTILGVIFFFLLLLVIYYSESVSYYLEQLAFVEKITLSGETASDSDRSDAWAKAIADGLKSPFLGNGPGYGKDTRETGYLSLFLLMLGDYGIIAFLLFIVFWFLLWYKTFLIKGRIRVYIILSFYSVTIAALLGDTSNSFVQWLLIPIIYKFYNNSKYSLIPVKYVVKILLKGNNVDFKVK